MKKSIYPLLAFVALTASILSCAIPFGGSDTPESQDNVATVVASTLQALTPNAPGTTQPAPSGLLPRTLYFLSNDSAGLTQVFRIEKDGKTQKQLTFEPAKVADYDVSAIDGSIAYISNNQLLWVGSDGSGRRVLVDGGEVIPDMPFVSSVSDPVWSPNSQTIAYGHKGLNFYAVATGISNRAIENQIDDFSGLSVPRELYWPERYSPDGSKLVITLGYYEGASAAIYYPAGNAVVRLTGGEGALICCGETEWTADGSSFFAASPSMGMFNPGLWRVNASTGAVTTLLSADAGNGTYNFADEPFLAPDGQLYFFFANLAQTDEFVSRTPLQLVRSAPDGVTGRTVVNADNFQLMNEALWAPDASFVIVAYAPLREVYQGGQAEIVHLDGRPNVVLAPFAINMKWGP